MGKRHKRRRMVNKLAPHRGSVILTERTIRLHDLQAALIAAPPTNPQIRELQDSLTQAMEQIIQATLLPPEMLGPSVTGLSLFSTMQPQRSRPLRSDFPFSAISLPATTKADRIRLFRMMT